MTKFVLHREWQRKDSRLQKGFIVLCMKKLDWDLKLQKLFTIRKVIAQSVICAPFAFGQCCMPSIVRRFGMLKERRLLISNSTLKFPNLISRTGNSTAQVKF